MDVYAGDVAIGVPKVLDHGGLALTHYRYRCMCTLSTGAYARVCIFFINVKGEGKAMAKNLPSPNVVFQTLSGF